MANIARLGVTLGLETATFQRGIDSAKKSLSDLAAKIPMLAAAGAAAFTAMAYKSIAFADEVSDLSAATDVSIASILQFGDAMRLSGGKVDDAGKVLARFSENIDSAAQGSKGMQDAFARVGVTLQDLAKMSPEQLFKKTVEGIAKMDDAATRSGLKMELFGKAMRSVDMVGFAEQIRESNEAFKEYEDSIKIAADLNDKLETKSRQLSLTFTKNVIPAVNDLFDTLNKKGGLTESIFKGVASVIEWATITIEAWTQIIAKLKNVYDYAFGDTSYFDFQKRNIEIENQRLELLRKIKGETLYDTENKPSSSSGNEQAIRKVTAARDAEADKMANMLRIAQRLSVEYERELDHSLLMLKIKNEMAFMTENEQKLQEAVNRAIDMTSKKIEQIQKQKEDAAGRGASEKVLAEYDAQIKKIEELGYQYSKLMLQEEESAIAAQRTFEFGWNKAFAQYAEDAENYAIMAADMFTAITGSMSRAIDTFVDTGKFAFKEFAVSIIKELLKIELKMQAMQMFSMLRSGISSFITGGFGGTGGTEVATALPVDLGSGFSSVGFAASGGTINSPTIVGERGPELFVPGRSGAVIPNNQLGNLGGNTYVTNNYIDAIDTKSFEDRIYGSSRAVWSANQFASKAISNNRSRT